MITEVNEIWENVSANVGDTGYRTYTRTFRVHSDIINEGPIGVGNDGRIPRRYDAYVNDATGETDPDALCTTVTVHTTEDPFTFLVSCEYTTENPLTVPCEVTWGTEQRTEVCDKDTTDDPILNSAGEPFDPPLQKEKHRLTLTVVKNLMAFDPDVYVGFINHVNNATWLNGLQHTWKCKDIVAVKQISKELAYWKVTFNLIYDEDTWVAYVLDQGWNEKDPGPPVRLKRIVDKKVGAMAARPVLLDGAGAAKEPDAAPTFRPFFIYPFANFDDLPFVADDL